MLERGAFDMIFHIVYQYSIANFSHMSPDFIWEQSLFDDELLALSKL